MQTLKNNIKKLHHAVPSEESPGIPVCAQGCKHEDGSPQKAPCATAQEVMDESEMVHELFAMYLG